MSGRYIFKSSNGTSQDENNICKLKKKLDGIKNILDIEEGKQSMNLNRKYKNYPGECYTQREKD